MWGHVDFGRLEPSNRLRPLLHSEVLSVSTWRYVDKRGDPQPVDHFSELDVIQWQWKFAGFHFGVGKSEQLRQEDYVFPYWPIVIPLTLLSAWLLLSNAE